MAKPRNAIVVLLDSLNRHMVGAYGGEEFDTPHLDRFAALAVRFDRHYSGSLPCMPARHDILCGALDFLWKPWGSIELWEASIAYHLERAGVKTMLCSDHPHLFETGGENYHTDFRAWEYLRGHEGDPWKMVPDPSWVGAPALPARRRGDREMNYDLSRTWFKQEADYPGPKTMAAASDWLRSNAHRHDRFMLFIDEFDPHEPFDSPEPWASRYDTWEGERIIWPPYATRVLEDGVLTEREAHHVRCNYGSKLSMIDHWFGRILQALDRANLWQSTAVIVCTDHGHYLGEKDTWGKPASPIFEPLGHIPLLVAWPGLPPGEVEALTTNVDIHATLLELFGVEQRQRTHGHSLLPLLTGRARSIRDWALSGIWAREIHLLDDRIKYACAPPGTNAPLSMWSNRWSTMPVHRMPNLRLPLPDDRARLDRMPASKVPVIRQPFAPGDRLPFWAVSGFTGCHVYDLAEDPAEERNLAGTPLEKRCREQLRHVLTELEAPSEQFERLELG